MGRLFQQKNVERRRRRLMAWLSFPVSRRDKSIAAILFVAQFIYYQFQASLELKATPWLRANQISFLPVNDPANYFNLLNIGVHAAFSVVIVYFLYRDRQSTWLVIYLSILLVGLYVATNLAGKWLDFPHINIISTKILFFIASPFKTIFSIPALQLRERDKER